MGVVIGPTPGPETLKGEKVIAEVYQDSIAESQGNTSIEETACIIAAIVQKEPNNTNISRDEIKKLQQESPDIQSAIRALELNDKEAIRRAWEKTQPKQRSPMQQFLIRQIQELNMDKDLLVVMGRNRTTKSCRWVLPPKGLEEQVRKIHQALAHPGRDTHKGHKEVCARTRPQQNLQEDSIRVQKVPKDDGRNNPERNQNGPKQSSHTLGVPIHRCHDTPPRQRFPLCAGRF